MTLREKMQEIHPELVAHTYGGGVKFCPGDYPELHAEKMAMDFCASRQGYHCYECWNLPYLNDDIFEIVHAHWRFYHKQNIAVCTHCSFERNLDHNFGKAVACPNCGAIMDE